MAAAVTSGISPWCGKVARKSAVLERSTARIALVFRCFLLKEIWL
jgi:hypothetical protein